MIVWVPPFISSIVIGDGKCFCIEDATPLKKKSKLVKQISVVGSMNEFVEIIPNDGSDAIYYPIGDVKKFSGKPSEQKESE